MAWGSTHPIKTLMSADGKARVLILSRDDGFYMFEAEAYWEDEGYTRWLPTHHSGIFDSAETAEREAICCVPWLKRQLRIGIIGYVIPGHCEAVSPESRTSRPS